uniref:Probable bifunctional methylthioribulose-1-phosphate dehydratase/enolase-phosphatase E1 n=1 Tax=Dunaliella tertiolecta TaxID=3047 RepID=A0A7S3R9P0_DUNTE|mmetsp:Transcript_26090/g.70683  ORF Transcript_26090/g.70683 Transcript_26090/m.70683 type:complete len:505 (-) Transcript_26090:645-2159(-)
MAATNGSLPPAVVEAKALVCELCRLFYGQGWVSGTGGGISVKNHPDFIAMAPSGVQKERMQPEDIFVLDAKGQVVETPKAKPPPARPPKLSECSPLFMAAYELRNAGAVIHSHSMNALLATLLEPDSDEFSVTHLEMIKGIEGHGFYGHCVVPVIENTARECELTDRMRQAIAAYPQSNAVLVRRHGVYVWGKDWIQAKTQAESYEYLFQAAVEMRKLGMDARRPPGPRSLPAAANSAAMNGSAEAPPSKRARQTLANGHQPLPTAIVLDIEGTVAPISFVADKLFPYARDNVKQHLEAHYGSEECQEDIQAIRQQAAQDASGTGIPDGSAGQAAVVDAVVTWVQAAIAADRKVTALKQLQGHIWRTGFEKGQLKAELFRDVPDALVEWRSAGLKTYIYSSGSREAQRQLFGHTQVGDMRPYLSGFFDTNSGPKISPASYKDIALSIGADSPSQLLFATDVLAEAEAASAAGWQAVLVTREGNKPIPAGHHFRVISNMGDLVQL